MFVCFLDLKNKSFVRKLSILILCAILILGLIVFAFLTNIHNDPVINGSRLSPEIGGRDDVVRICGFFDLTIRKEDLTEVRITIPNRFNSIYEEYNELQKPVCTNLSDYKGKACVKYSAPLIGTDSDEQAVVTILSCNGRFIGGDISGKEYGSFILPLTGRMERNK